MNPRLAAMRSAMLGRSAPSPAPVATPRAQPQTSAAAMIVQLRTALFAERKARLAAEARLRAVLAEIARTPRAAPPPAVETYSLPAPASEAIVTVEGEVVEEGGEYLEGMSVRDHLAAIGGDDDGQED